jgi:hypothetical protein
LEEIPMAVRHTAEGIEIDHGDRDISAALRNNIIEVGIGEGCGDGPGGSYARWAEINLTLDEALALRDWLASKIGATARAEGWQAANHAWQDWLESNIPDWDAMAGIDLTALPREPK